MTVRPLSVTFPDTAIRYVGGMKREILFVAGAPVLFLTGHVTDRIDKPCLEKAIPMLRIPEAIDLLRGEIRLLLEDF